MPKKTRAPSPMARNTPGGAAGTGSAGARATITTTPKKLTALRRNATGAPAAATRNPPSAGPTARAMFQLVDWSAMASGMCRAGTSPATKVHHAGPATAFPTPSAVVTSRSETGVTRPRQVRNARRSEAAAFHSWAAQMMIRRSIRSASTPEKRTTKTLGIHVVVVTSATWSADPPSASITAASPTSCKNVPTLDTTEAT